MNFLSFVNSVEPDSGQEPFYLLIRQTDKPKTHTIQINIINLLNQATSISIVPPSTRLGCFNT